MLFGREDEIARIQKIAAYDHAKIIVVYGRRRVGKTTLLKHVFHDRNLIFIEGLQNKTEQKQRGYFITQLARALRDNNIELIKTNNWLKTFGLLNQHVQAGAHTIYLEEIQWMAAYKDNLVSELKYVWDNHWQHNKQLILILCGSSPSFLIDKIMKSSALYNRSMYEIALDELSLAGAQQLFGCERSQLEVLDAYLSIGGIPEYLKYLKSESSVFLSLLKRSCAGDEYFVNEAERVFVSNMANNRFYRSIIELLAKHGPQTRQEIVTKLKISSGGSTSKIFDDLLKCGFIGVFTNLSYGKQTRNSFYFLRDNYLDFYYSFIHPNLNEIKANNFKDTPNKLLPYASYRQWLGYRLERFCLANSRKIAQILGFDNVKYQSGPYLVKDPSGGVQLDLVFKRRDRVITVCEIKYTEVPPGMELKHQLEEKLSKISQIKPFKGQTIQRVLISPTGTKEELANSAYFDAIVDIKQLFQAK